MKGGKMIDLKKAQAEVITTVLIILLVLAAVVIVWQVVGRTIESGGEQITSQTGCIGVDIEVACSDHGNCTAKRSAQGGIFSSSDLIVIVDGTKLAGTEYTSNPATNSLLNPLDTATIRLNTAAATSIEVGVIGDGTTCPMTGTYTF